MQTTLLLITTCISLMAFIVAVYTLLTQRIFYFVQRIHKLSDRLYELDKLLMQYPDAQRVIFENTNRKAPYFSADTAHDDLYFRVKTTVYMQLNFFDEIFSTVSGDRRLEELFEFQSWVNYICRKLRHPLFKELYRNESGIWGDKFRRFCEANRARIDEAPEPEIF